VWSVGGASRCGKGNKVVMWCVCVCMCVYVEEEAS